MGVALPPARGAFPPSGSLPARHARIEQHLYRPLDPNLTAWRADRMAFAAAAGIPLDPWQAEVVTSPAPRILLNCSRQSGKSTVTAVLACHTALFAPGSLILLLSRAQRQSQELFRKTLDVYHAVGSPIPSLAASTMVLELANGSRVVALPGSEASIRSFSDVSLLLVDEAARVPDDTYYSMRPVLAVSGGRLVALSTPYGTRGWWYEAWRGAEGTADDWQRWRVPASECPRIAPAFLEEERRTIGSWWYQQEYGCEFLDAESAAFRSEDIDRAVQDYDIWDFGHFQPTRDEAERAPVLAGGGAWNLNAPRP